MPPEIICYSQQFHRCVTNIMDNEGTLNENENVLVITI